MLLSQRGPAWASWREGGREARAGGGQAAVPAGIHAARQPGARARTPGARALELSTRPACLPSLHRPLWLPLSSASLASSLCPARVLASPAPAAMVAGMLMPLDQLRTIYEVLFREGVMVAKKDRRPRILHPHVPGVTNLQVMRAMASLRARGLVRETFAWRHFYWYLTNEGVAHLRQYLHLPPEIVPASLQRVRRPVAMVMPARRTPHVQTVQGPLGYLPKRGRLPVEDPAHEERRVYRRKEPDEGAPEPPVVTATTPGTLARPGPEPAPATGQLHPGLCLGMGGGAWARVWWAGQVERACGSLARTSRWRSLCLKVLGAGVIGPRGSSWLEDLGWPGLGGACGPCQPIPRHTLGLGVGLVALDWQDQLLAQPCLSPALSPSVPHSRLCSTALMPVVCLPQAGAWGVGPGMDQV